MSPASKRRRTLAALVVPALAIACLVAALGAAASACSTGSPGASPPPSGDAASIDAADAGTASNLDAASDVDAMTACDAGLQVCDGACVDLTSSHDHCGACSVACPADHFCRAAQCHTCAEEGLQACATGCADVLTDLANCGACGHACAAGQLCQGGSCVAPPCPDGGSSCGGHCIDTSSDPSNCGGCGHACVAGQACGGGACLCADASTVACGATCVDPSTDPQHCGATAGCGVNAGYAGLTCVSTGFCKAGACQLCQAWSTGWTYVLSDAGLSSGSVFAAADFNNDGHPDLALLNRDTGNVTVLAGQANATFSPGASYSVGSGAMYIAAGDFNADGKQDFAVSSSQPIGSTTQEYVLVWLGKGNLTFAPGPSVGRQAPANHIVAGDLNGDGRADLVVEGGSNAADLRVFLAQPSGPFSVGANIISSLGGPTSANFALSDVDVDGRLDLVASTLGPTLVLWGKGDGTFDTPWASPVGIDGNYAFVVGDVNGDGKPDLLWQATPGAQSQWWIALNEGSRSFRYPANVPWPERVGLLSDVTKDGIPDFVGIDNTFPTSMYVHAGHGDGTFLPAHSFPYSDQFGDSLFAHDLNGDGYVDVVGSTYEKVLVLLGSKAADAGCP